MAKKGLVDSHTPPRKAMFLINFPKSSGCWPVDTWEWCASKNVTVLQAHHSQVLKLNLIWRKVLINLIIFRISGYIQNNTKRGRRKYCRNQKVLIYKVARLRWRQTRAHPCGSVSILLGICDNIQTCGIFQPLLWSQRSCQSCKNVSTVPTSWCYFFWPVLIFGKSTQKTGENTRKQAKTGEKQVFFWC